MNNLFFLKSTEILLQPYGSFISNKSINQFHILDNAATAIALKLLSDSKDKLPYGNDNITEVSTFLLDTGILTKNKSESGFPKINSDSTNILNYVRADIEVTNRCNLSCSYCYAEVNRSNFELSFDEWKEIIRSLIKKGLRAVLFSGGEPFMKKDFMDIVTWASEFLIIEINTNGRFINDEICKQLKALNLKRIQVSLDSIDPTYHDEQRGKNSHKFAIEAIKLLREFDVPVQISTVATRSNDNEIPKLISFAEEQKCSINIAPISKNGFAKNIPDDVWAQKYETDYQYFSDKNTPTTSGVSPLCQSAIGYVAISFTGDLKPCNQRESYFAPTNKTSLVSRKSKWWKDDFQNTPLGDAVSSLPFDGLKIEIQNNNDSVCDLQNYFLNR